MGLSQGERQPFSYIIYVCVCLSKKRVVRENIKCESNETGNIDILRHE